MLEVLPVAQTSAPAATVSPYGDGVRRAILGGLPHTMFVQAAPGLHRCWHVPQFAPSLEISVSHSLSLGVVQLANPGAHG
jgi:hypothetical protein